MSEQPEPSRYSLPGGIVPVLPLTHLPPGWADDIRAIVREELARAGLPAPPPLAQPSRLVSEPSANPSP